MYADLARCERVDECPDVRRRGKTATRAAQLVLARMLRLFHLLCEAAGTPYWVMFGTLLGAVRHQGFIPWDTDVDVAMRAADLERWRAQHGPATLARLGLRLEPDPAAHMYRLRDEGGSCYTEWVAGLERAQRRSLRDARFPLQLDIFLLAPAAAGQLAVHPGDTPKLRFPQSWFTGPGRVLAFEGFPVLAPREPEACLEREYGPGWRALPPPAQRVSNEGAADPFRTCNEWLAAGRRAPAALGGALDEAPLKSSAQDKSEA
jgi:hypothetical protein